FRGIGAVVDAGARGRVDVLRICRIDDNAHYIGVVNHALGNGGPVFAAVGGLPGKVIGSGVDDIIVAGVKGDGIEILEVVVLGWRDAFPICAFIGRAINAGQ